MAEKFHINGKGEPGRCSAQHGGCPFGGENEHYVTKEGASVAYERSMADGSIPKLTKVPTRDQVVQVLDSMARGEDTIPEGVEFEETPKKEITSESKPPTDMEARLSETPKERRARWAETDAKVHENVVLFGQDEENLKDYNSFANRTRRLFTEKKNVLSERSRLKSLPAGQKLIDYDPINKTETVWTKTGEDHWTDKDGNVSTDNSRKLPATIVE